MLIKRLLNKVQMRACYSRIMRAALLCFCIRDSWIRLLFLSFVSYGWHDLLFTLFLYSCVAE